MKYDYISIGQVFGNWTVVGNSIPRQGYLCKCKCGAIKRVTGYALANSKSTQCALCRYEDLWKNHMRPNKYDLSGEYGKGWTNNTQKEFIFDKDKYDLIKNMAWNETKSHHITAGHVYLQLVVYGKENIPTGYVLEHLNGELSDCRIENLKPISKQMSLLNRKFNSKIYPGVTKNRSGTYSAEIMVNGVAHRIGTYKTAEEAIKARKEEEKKNFGTYTKRGEQINTDHVVLNPINSRGRNLSNETKEILRKYYPSMGSKVISEFNLNISPKSIHAIVCRMGLKYTGEK